MQTNDILPIFSNCTTDKHKDIPILTPDELVQIFGIHSISRNCLNPYDNLKVVPWSKRRPTLVFRGSATGCGNDVGTNQRFHISMIDAEWQKNSLFNSKNGIDNVAYLDAGIVSWGTRRMKIIRGTKIASYPNIPQLMKKYNIKLKSFMSMQEQREFKYVLYIEGNVLAYRLAYLFSTKSVVFYVESDYKPWFFDQLEDEKNCIFVKNDFSNLADAITWCKKNDKLAKTIAENGYKLYKDVLGNKQYAINYMHSLLYA
jgi:hypothetical protein